MNILVVYTGGTIGSAVENGYINTNEAQLDALLSLYKAYDTSSVRFTCVSPFYILSENMNGSYLQKLAQCITDCLMSGPDTSELNINSGATYDGVIVTHGTDTLQYTAAGLFHLFPKIDLPIVFVSSNYILEDARANGFANFAAAVSFIKKRLGTGVFAAYQNNSIPSADEAYASGMHVPENDLSPIYIHCGNQMLPHAVYSDAIYSLNNAYYCKILPTREGEQISYEAYVMNQSDTSKTPASPVNCQQKYKDAGLSDESGILMLYTAPGMYFPKPETDMKAILLIAYHSGTLPTKNSAFIDFVTTAYNMGIPVYVAGAVAEGGAVTYQSTSVFDELHIKVLAAMSPIDAYMQLMLSI